MKKLLLFVVLSATLVISCTPEPEIKKLSYENIIILSDMSSRIHNSRFPQKDMKEIHGIVQYFKDKCVRPGEKIGDKSSISFLAFSDNTKLSIDLNDFKDLGKKQRFINSTGDYKNKGLENELSKFENEIKSSYESKETPGLDLISLLIEKFENNNLVKENKVIPHPNGLDTTFINFNNHIHIFTDGYLEYSMQQKRVNSEFYFGKSEIEKVRQYCKRNNIDVEAALKKENSLCLPIYKSKKNKFLNLHVLETQERDRDTKFQTYKNPKGLRDNEILEAIWRKWSFDSGFKSFEWKKY
jgi:hypothetical protein